jgi:Tfp pilus assembly protein PilF
MRRSIFILLFLSITSPVYSGDKNQNKTVPAFTDSDLQKYKVKGVTDSEMPDKLRKEKMHPQLPSPMDARSVFKENDLSVVSVIAYKENGISFSHGSGFIVTSDGAVVTNYHVISNAAYVKVKAGKIILEVEGLLYSDKENDIVILKANGMNLPTVNLGDSDMIEEKEKVFVMSSPRGSENIISEGVLNGRKRAGSDRELFLISANFSEGSSGGPVFNEKGEVIGIATSVIDKAKNLNFASPVNLIKGNFSSQKAVTPQDALSDDYRLTADYWFNIANNFSKAAKYNDAVEAYKKALSYDPYFATAYNGLGVAYMKLKMYKKAIKFYKKSIMLDPNSSWVYSNLGLVYTESAMYKEAIDELKRALRITPDLAVAHFNLGLTYRRLHEHKKALDSYKEAVRIDPGFVDAHFHLGKTYVDLNEKDAALDEYNKLKDLDPVLADKLMNLIERYITVF